MRPLRFVLGVQPRVESRDVHFEAKDPLVGKVDPQAKSQLEASLPTHRCSRIPSSISDEGDAFATGSSLNSQEKSTSAHPNGRV